MSYRPICDTWILARSKVKYYGAYPAGFLGRARQLLGISINQPLLHVCGGKVKEYPFYGYGPNDRTIDLDPAVKPDFLMDVREIGVEEGDEFPPNDGQPGWKDGAHRGHVTVQHGQKIDPALFWPAALIDRPYTEEDAEHYLNGTGMDVLPDINGLLKRVLSIVGPGGRVGVLDYFIPRPPKTGVRFVACVGVMVGYANRGRFYTVFENDPNFGRKAEAEESLEDEDETPPQTPEQAEAALASAVANAPAATGENCVACGGTGKASKSRKKGSCAPCGGTGKKKADAPAAPAPSAPAPVAPVAAMTPPPAPPTSASAAAMEF